MKRKLYIDVIRIVAIFAVVLLHVAADNFYVFKYTSFEWQVLNVYDSLVRFCVPLFFMISGVLFLRDDKEIDIKQLYKKYILRLLIAYVFWSLFYAVFNTMVISYKPFVLDEIIRLTIKSSGHLWFIPVLICIYMLVPFLRKFINKDNMRLVKYFLLLFLIFGVIKVTALNLFEDEYLKGILNIFKPDLIASYIGYFVLGYYLDNIEIDKKKLKYIYLLGIISVISIIILNNNYAYMLEKNTTMLYDFYSLPVFTSASAIFLFIKNINFKKGIFIKNISLLSFGVYLTHPAILRYLVERDISSSWFNPIFSVPLISLFVFVISMFISFILSKIPIIKKYLV